MVNSLENYSLHFIRQVHSDLSKPNQNMNTLSEIIKIAMIKLLNI